MVRGCQRQGDVVRHGRHCDGKVGLYVNARTAFVVAFRLQLQREIFGAVVRRQDFKTIVLLLGQLYRAIRTEAAFVQGCVDDAVLSDDDFHP